MSLIFAGLLISQNAVAATQSQIETRFPQAKDSAQLIAQFPVLASLLSIDHPWNLDVRELKAKVLPEQVQLIQGTETNPLVYNGERSGKWPGSPVWNQVSYDIDFFVFNPAHPVIKIYLGRPIIERMQLIARAEPPQFKQLFPTLPETAPAEIFANVKKVVASLESYGAKEIAFEHPRIHKYLLPGGTQLTFNDFSGTGNGTVFMEIDLEPAEDIAGRADNRLPAFPGAEGFGAFSRGGRGGKVFVVTSLEDYLPEDRPGRAVGTYGQAAIPPANYDSEKWLPYVDGAGVPHPEQRRPLLPAYPGLSREAPISGTLREACEAAGPRTIVFAVSGAIGLKAPLVIRNPFVTLAGNTAPGDGVLIRNWPIIIETNDVILRYLRVRIGDIKGPGDMPRVMGDQSHALDASGVNIIIDHCEFAFANDQIVNLYGTKPGLREGVSFQWNYVYGGLVNSTHEKGAHSMSYFVSGWGYSSMHHNLTAHTRNRNPRVWGQDFDYRNNILYDYWGAGYGESPNMYTRMNFVGNLQKRGKWTWGFEAAGPCGIYYETDNVMPAGSTQVLKVPANNLFKQPIAMAPVSTQSPQEAYEDILRFGGASLPVRDSVTQYVADTTRNNTGDIPNTTKDFPDNGFPVYKQVPPVVDTDHDGLPDDWETAHGLNPRDPADANLDKDNDGYTNLEEYINGTDPGVFVNYRDPANNRDPRR
ncbi:MAG TPA: hypothetical protein VHD56_12125 [Tepidisphaeraceae bacterium]|nr:hypothetical protein [Tepidisphaeraceae bacterium]